MGFGEKSGTGADVIAKGWKDNGWSILMVEEKNNPDRIETWLKLGNNANVATEFSTISMEKTQDRVLADNGNLVASCVDDTTMFLSFLLNKLSIRGRR